MNIDHITIFGAGAAGTNIFFNLVSAYPALNFKVVDFDKVELRNVTPGTQPYSKTDINRPKVQALQRLALMQREKRIDIHNAYVKTTAEIANLVPNPSRTVVIDAFDNADSRNLFLGLGKAFHVLHIGFSEALTGEAVWDTVFTKMEHSEADEEIDVCELHLARPFISALTAQAAILVADFIETGKKKNIYFDRTLKLMVF